MRTNKMETLALALADFNNDAECVAMPYELYDTTFENVYDDDFFHCHFLSMTKFMRQKFLPMTKYQRHKWFG